MAQQHELLDQLVSKMPEGSRPVLHSDMGWQYQQAGWCKRLEEAVSVNIFFTIFTNVFSPIAPTRMRRIRQRGCAAFGV